MKDEILVSICCITYNHEAYIAEALDGFLMQKTNFKYEIIIGEDSSTDRTREIIEEYIVKHPNLITLLPKAVNIGALKNQLNTLQKATGKYVALCDGDDYWTDVKKLQKQVDYIESNDDCAICCHYSRVINEQGELVYENTSPVSLQFGYEDILLGNKEETRVCTMLTRNMQQLKEMGNKEWYYKTHGSDTFFKLYTTQYFNGNIHVLPEVMSVYRLHRNGVWSMIDNQLRKSRMISDFNIMIRNFSYSTRLKKELLKMYITQFLLFDIKKMKFQQAIKTIFTLV